MLTYTVPNMNCGHCTAKIQKSVKAIDPVATVSCDIPARRVTVDSTLTDEAVRADIRDAGYKIDRPDSV